MLYVNLLRPNNENRLLSQTIEYIVYEYARTFCSFYQPVWLYGRPNTRSFIANTPTYSKSFVHITRNSYIRQSQLSNDYYTTGDFKYERHTY